MDITKVRKEIDHLDDGMLDLFLRRMRLAEEAAAYKNQHGLPVLDRGREREILSRVSEEAGEMEEYAYYFFSKLMDLSRARQNELFSAPTRVRAQVEQALSAAGAALPKTGTVACPGVEGSNAQLACDKLLPRGRLMYVKNFRAVFDAVDSGLCQYGVVPIENSTNGSVRAVYDLLLERKFSIVAATSLCIRHALLTKPGQSLEQVREIYSHEQAIGQCSRFLSGLENVQVIPCENTATAAKMVAESGRPGAAAIAAPQCEALYGLQALRGDIQDNDNNYTRFICITKAPAIYAGANKISLVLACDNKPGALNEILSKLAAHGVNMDKLESCPVAGRDFEFIFFLELDASVSDPGVLSMLEDLERTCASFDLLGNYAIL